MLRFAYNTNGLQSHRLEDALTLLAESGYAGVALTLDHMHLDPHRVTAAELRALRRTLEGHGLAVSIETGARFILDPRRKHRPSWLEPIKEERERRAALIGRALEIGAELGAESVVVFSGVSVGPAAESWPWLLEGLSGAAVRAQELAVPLALEPEPGHLVATIPEWRRCHEAVPDILLALDVGHIPASEPGRAIPRTIVELGPSIGAVHIEDSRGQVHEHLPFGEGTLDHEAILAALVSIRYRGLVAVELSRHSHAAHELVPASIQFLRARLPRGQV